MTGWPGGGYCPWRDAERRHPEILIEESDDIDPAGAAWVAALQVIVVNGRRRRVEQRCSLAHELAHVDQGHCPTGIDHLDRRQERAAHRLAARRLIDIDDLAQALAYCPDIDVVADVLDVDRRTVDHRVATLTAAERAIVDEVARSIEQAA